MISTVLIPIIKDKSGDVTDKSNYRLIALPSIVSEHLLLKYMQSFLYSSDNQFGFKAKHSTAQCIYVLKGPLKKLLIFIKTLQCFMDALKAFDRVNPWTWIKHSSIVVFLIF